MARQQTFMDENPLVPQIQNLDAQVLGGPNDPFQSNRMIPTPQGLASLPNMRYDDSQRQQAFGNDQQRLLNQMNQFGLRPARGR